jgi:CRP/FNR family cyclic AMP-dependent transcriptional regulator
MMIDSNLLIAWGATYKKITTGKMIFTEGAQANFYYQVESGSVKWVSIKDDGTEFIHHIMCEGESFGELPLFDDEPYAATAVAETDGYILRLHKDSFHELLKEYPEIHLAFTKLITQRLRYKFFLIREVASHHPEQTLVSVLSELKKNNNHFCPESTRLKLTRQQLADMTGMRVETVIRAMRHMNDKGLIRIRHGKVFC